MSCETNQQMSCETEMDPADRKKLQKLRLELLQNITDCKRIIDGLFVKGTLNRVMKEKVLKKTDIDQLREILDILPRRGPEAMRVFYEVLVDCGEDVAADLLYPELAVQRKEKQAEKHVPLSGVQESCEITGDMLAEDELLKKWPDMDSHDPSMVSVVNVSERDQLMKACFAKAAAGNGTMYPMDKPVRGICLLLSNQDFKEARANSVELADREGTDKDHGSLETLFTKLGFYVILQTDFSAQKILEAVQDQCSQDHANYNCFVCIVLSHGERDVIYGVDGKTISVLELRDAVVYNCRTLVGKPKLFFFQACRGKRHDKGYSAVDGCGAAGLDPQLASVDKEIDRITDSFIKISVEDETESDDASQGRVSSESEVFVAMATVPGFASWRDKNWGTWFIQAVVFVFSKLAYKYDLLRLMTRVNQLVSRAETKTGCKQVSIFKSSLTRDFYFFPGLPQETDMAGETKESSDKLRGRQTLEKWLNKSMKIKMSDGRTLIGVFLCTDRDGNVILGTCEEYIHGPESEEEEPRVLGLAMVPGHHILSIHVDQPQESPS